MKKHEPRCMHDHKNAIQVGKIDFKCQLCGQLIDPFEWFLMNSFEFVDEKPNKDIKQKLEKRLGRSVVTKKNLLNKKPEIA